MKADSPLLENLEFQLAYHQEQVRLHEEAVEQLAAQICRARTEANGQLCMTELLAQER